MSKIKGFISFKKIFYLNLTFILSQKVNFKFYYAFLSQILNKSIENLIMHNLDEYDIQILNLLEKDGRMAFSAIATELGISNTMVHQRITKLTEQDILRGVKPVLNEKKIGYDWGAFTGITLEKDHDSERIIEELKSIPEVTECYYITGTYTLYLRIVAKNHEHMRHILYDRIDNIQGIAKTDSMIELGCAFKRNIGL